MKRDPHKKRRPLTKTAQRRAAARAAKQILHNITWAEMPEGEDYWHEVWGKLVDFAEGR